MLYLPDLSSQATTNIAFNMLYAGCPRSGEFTNKLLRPYSQLCKNREQCVYPVLPVSSCTGTHCQLLAALSSTLLRSVRNTIYNGCLTLCVQYQKSYKDCDSMQRRQISSVVGGQSTNDGGYTATENVKSS